MSISETLQLQPYKWWRLNGTVTGMYKTIQMTEDKSKSLNQKSVMVNLSNNISLPYGVDFELSGRYSSSQLISNIIVRSRYTIDLGLQKKVLKDMGAIKVGFDDIFKTGNGSAYAKYDNVDIDVTNHWDSRRLNISFNYRFGKDNFKTRANRSTSSSEEQNRSSK